MNKAWRFFGPGSAGDQASSRCHGGWVPPKMVVDSLTWVRLREVDDFFVAKKIQTKKDHGVFFYNIF